MRQRLDIADVEARTKIRAKYLRALENEEFGMLPGPTFVKTFLRTYAEMLGLDPHVLVEEYRANYEGEDELDAPAARPGRRRRGATGATGRGSARARSPCSRWWRSSRCSWRSAWRATTELVTGRPSAARRDGDRDRAPPRRRRPSRRRRGAWPYASSRRRPRTSASTAAPAQPVVFENTIDSAAAFRGRRLRVQPRQARRAARG